MTLPWNSSQIRQVTAALREFHIGTSKCAAAARRVLPLARQLNDQAHGVQLAPMGAARYVLTKTGHRAFFHHVVVDVAWHRVDALTGPQGHPTHSYLNKFFKYPEAIREAPVDVESIDVGIQSDD